MKKAKYRDFKELKTLQEVSQNLLGSENGKTIRQKKRTWEFWQWHKPE